MVPGARGASCIGAMGTVESTEAPLVPGSTSQSTVLPGAAPVPDDGEVPLEPEATIPPWHSEDEAASASMKQQMFAFTALPPAERRVLLGGDSPPGFRHSMRETAGMAMAALEGDPNLQKARDMLVRYAHTDLSFWRCYFHLGTCSRSHIHVLSVVSCSSASVPFNMTTFLTCG